MNYLPFENITYTTKHDPEEIRKRLNEVVEPKKLFRISKMFGNSDYKPYEGIIYEHSFSIKRIIGYRNSFLPNINGSIEKDLNGSKITVKMRLHLLVIIFLFIWCGGVGFFFLPMLLYGVSFEPVALIPIGMLTFMYAVTIGGFKYESIKSKKYLAELFDAEIKK